MKILLITEQREGKFNRVGSKIAVAEGGGYLIGVDIFDRQWYCS